MVSQYAIWSTVAEPFCAQASRCRANGLSGLQVASLSLWLVAMPRYGLAQATSASVNGTVRDQSGALISDVQIVLAKVDTGVQRTGTTGSAGVYSLGDLPPGDYSAQASKDGFAAEKKTGIVLQVNQTAMLDFTLTVGVQKETVTVASKLSMVDSTTSELGTVITTGFVANLPLNGRNFTQLVELTPGLSPVSVAQNSSGGNGFGGLPIGSFIFPAVNGQRNRSNMFLLDGANDMAFLGNYNYAPIIDDIQEFKIQSNNDLAEFGGVSGGIVNVLTKAGTNSFHGAAWEFLRNEQLDARNFFLPARNPLRQNQFGATSGGPVVIPKIYQGRNRTFFFFAYEGFRQSQRAQTITRTPTPAQLGGDFSSLLDQGIQLYNPFSTQADTANPGEFVREPFPGNIIPTQLLSPAAKLYANTLFPSGAPIPGGNLYDTTPSRLSQDSYTNWQPRLGIAHRLRDTTSLRAGYGHSYDEWNGYAQTPQNIGGTWPSVGSLNVNSQNQNVVTATIGNPVGLGSTTLVPAANPFGISHFYYDPHLKTPLADHWNFEIDQQLGSLTDLSVIYVGERGRNLDLGVIFNTAEYPGAGDAATVAARQPYPYITPTRYDTSLGYSDYEALEVRLSRATRNGLAYLLSYTWSKSIDLACSGDYGVEGCEVQNVYDLALDRSVSGFDLPQSFVGSVYYELPFGRGKPDGPLSKILWTLGPNWELNGILTFHSGVPYDVTYQGDLANTGNTFVRANLVGNPNLQHPTHFQWFSTAAFAIPAPYIFGDLGRNSLRSDWSQNLDCSLFRRFPIRDKAALTLRIEAFNAFNSVVFAAPGNVINGPNFGVVTSTANQPRQVQVALKVC